MKDGDKAPGRRLADEPSRFANTCRMRAEQMQTIALGISDKSTRDILERQARDWAMMAEDAERRANELRNRRDD
jgi:hypothetical protein